MKKLLFSLVATAACGAVSAAVEDFSQYTLGAEFSAATNTSGEVSSSNPGYWTINMMSDTPEMLITNNVTDTTDKYLQINTGSTPLWRTFEPVTSVADATSGNPTTNAVGDVTRVQSDVKLTACTEFPNIPDDFVNEKLALFLYAPEDEAAAAANPGGLYAVGGKIVDSALVATAYRLDVEANAITNSEGWATIAIKSYADVMSNNTGNEKYPGFVIAVAPKGSQVTVVSAVEQGYTPGFNTGNLTSAAATRIGNRTLIPSAKTSVSSEDYPNGTLLGLGFQGEGGIDNVNLAADDFAVDAVAMNVSIPQGVEYTGITLDNGVFSFTGTDAVTITLKDVADKAVTADYGKDRTATVAYGQSDVTVTFTPVKDTILTIAVKDAKFQIGGGENVKKYATLAEALDGLTSGDTLKLLDNANAGEDGVAFGEGTYTIDLNGFTLSAAEDVAVIYNEGGAVTIIDSSVTDTDKVGTGKVDGYIENAEGTLAIYAGTYEGNIFTNEEGEEAEFVGTTTIYGGKFADKVEDATLVDGVWKQDGNYWTIGAATPAPSIKAEDGLIAEDADGDYVVTPADENVTEVNITVGDYTGNVIVPSTVTKITGTIAPAQIGVQLGAYKVIGAFKLNEANEIVLNKDATVKVGNEDIKVEPELANTAADGETEVAPFEAGAEPAATIKTIPGLTYSLDFDSDVKGAFGTSAASKTADGNRMTLQDKNTNGATQRFYKIRVRK